MNYKTIYNTNLKKSIFRTINSKEKAYWLGFIMADGYIPKNNNFLRIELSTKDKNMLLNFQKFIKGGRIYTRIGKSKTKIIGIIINNKTFCDFIKNHGIESPKSRSIRLIDFKNKKINKAFILGFYDGDGSERSPVLTSSSYYFLKDVKKEYSIKAKIYKNRPTKVYELYLGVQFMKEIQKNYLKSLVRKRSFTNGYEKCKCGNKKFSKNSLSCKNCYGLKKRKFQITKKELKKLLMYNNFVKVGKMLNVSDNAIRKRCKLLKINL